MGMWAPLLLIGESTNESSSSNAGKRPLTRLDARLDAKKERRRGLSFVLRLSYLSVTRVDLQLTYLILRFQQVFFLGPKVRVCKKSSTAVAHRTKLRERFMYHGIMQFVAAERSLLLTALGAAYSET